MSELWTCTLTTSTSVEAQVIGSSTSLTCPSVSTVTTLMGTATRLPVRMAVFTTSVSYRRRKDEHNFNILFNQESFLPHLTSFTEFLFTVAVNYWNQIIFSKQFCQTIVLTNVKPNYMFNFLLWQTAWHISKNCNLFSVKIQHQVGGQQGMIDEDDKSRRGDMNEQVTWSRGEV